MFFWMKKYFSDLFLLFPLLLSNNILPVLSLSESSLSSQNNSTSGSITTTEYNALKTLYNSTNGEYWTWRRLSSNSIPWNFSVYDLNAPCSNSWQGLLCLCQSGYCSIQGINLTSHGLLGSIPPAIGEFSRLTDLVLSHNSISGFMPPTLANLRLLESLDLRNNLLIGEIPDLTGLSILKRLVLSRNFLNGSLPDSLYDCGQLEVLDLEYNDFAGSISRKIGNLTQLLQLWLSFNQFTGILPAEVGSLRHLVRLDLMTNYFFGTLPSSLYTLYALRVVDISNNGFSGTISPKVGNLTKLHVWISFNNSFFGSIPRSWFNPMTPMRTFDLAGNLFSGPLPGELSNWKSTLQTMYFSFNSLTGNVPFELNEIELVIVFIVTGNFLFGNVSNMFLHQKMMTDFNLVQNAFTGNLPGSFNWRLMSYYSFAENYFTGPFPNNINRSKVIYYIDVAYNHLTGEIPKYFNDRAKDSLLTYANFSYNDFSGNISDTFEDLNKLVTLSLNDNRLTGTIPYGYGGILRLQYLLLNDNQFTGPVPASLSALIELKVLLLQNNKFTGTLHNVFQWNSLETIDLSNNVFTGTLPVLLTNNSAITTFAVSSNCFHGSLSAIVCRLTSLQVISADGLATASSCQSRIFPVDPYFTAFTLKESFSGGVPKCVYNMPNLQTLHLSGNGLTGSFPSDLTISPSLTDLSLSHNRLSGTIPNIIQEREWENLCLSYNKFTGTLSSQFHAYNESQIISMDVNRLSGTIPTSLINAAKINLVNGNMFACNYNSKYLPKNDPQSETYSCGSDVMNMSLYIGIGVFVVAFAVICVVIRFRHQWLECYGKFSRGKSLHEFIEYLQTIRAWRNCFLHASLPPLERLKASGSVSVDNSISSTTNVIDSQEELCTSNNVSFHGPQQRKYHRIHKLSLFFRKARFIFFALTGLMVFFLLPCYVVLSHFYRSYTNSYIWTLSSTFLTGKGAGICLLIMYFSTLLLMLNIFKFVMSPYIYQNAQLLKEKPFRSSSKFEDLLFLTTTRFRESITKEKSNWTAYWTYLIIGIGNSIIMGLADVLYVYIIFHDDTSITVTVEILLAGFKIFLNKSLWKAIPYLQNRLDPAIIRNRNSVVDESRFRASEILSFDSGNEGLIKLYKFTAQDLNFISLTIFLNNLIFPAIALSIVSSDCFYNAFFAAQGVSSTYTYNVCANYIFNRCREVVQFQGVVSYNPPFIYSYQCSSEIVINYAPVFIFMIFFEGFMLPVYYLLVKFIYDQYRSKSKDVSLLHNKQSTEPSKLAIETISPIHTVEEKKEGSEKPETLEITTQAHSGDEENIIKEDLYFKRPNASLAHDNLSQVPQKLENASLSSRSSLRPKIPWYFRLLFLTLPHNLQQLIPEPSYQLKSEMILFDKNRVVVKLNTYFVMLMSFGVIFPPLSIIIFLAMISFTVYEETMIGRILYDSERMKCDWYGKQIDKNCSGVVKAFKYSRWTLIPGSCLLFSYIIFDTWGDETGWKAALLPTLLMLMVPVLLLLYYYGRKAMSSFLSMSSPAANDLGATSSMLDPEERVLASDESKLSIAIENNSQFIASPRVEDAEQTNHKPCTSLVKEKKEENESQNDRNLSVRRSSVRFSIPFRVSIANISAFQPFDYDSDDSDDVQVDQEVHQRNNQENKASIAILRKSNNLQRPSILTTSIPTKDATFLASPKTEDIRESDIEMCGIPSTID